MKGIPSYRAMVLAGVALLAVVGGIFAWRSPEGSASSAGGTVGGATSPLAGVAGVVADSPPASPRERRAEEIAEARKEVWALAGTGKDFRGAVAALDRNWERLGEEDQKQLTAAVVAKITAAGKLADPELFQASTREALRMKIGSHVARAMGETDLAGAIDFISSIPEAKIRDRIASDGLQSWPKMAGTEEGTKLFSDWLREETDAAVRLTIWDAIYSNKPGHWTQGDVDEWVELGRSLGVVAE